MQAEDSAPWQGLLEASLQLLSASLGLVLCGKAGLVDAQAEAGLQLLALCSQLSEAMTARTAAVEQALLTCLGPQSWCAIGPTLAETSSTCL